MSECKRDGEGDRELEDLDRVSAAIAIFHPALLSISLSLSRSLDSMLI